MRSSPTCRSRRTGWRAALLGVLAALATPTGADAIDPQRALSQYIRDRWGPERGFPGGPVYAISQTPDGYLWIAAEKGLVRFDGFAFELFTPTGPEAGSGPTVLGLSVDADGDLWARQRGPSLVRRRNGRFEPVRLTDAPGTVVTAMAAARDGSTLIAPLSDGIVARRGGETRRIVTPAALSRSFVIAIAASSDGDIWLGTRDAGLLRVRGAQVTAVGPGLRDPKINCLLPGERGDLWIGGDRGVMRLVAGEITTAGVPEAARQWPALAMLRDRQGSVWLAAGAHGVLRIDHRGVAAVDAWDARTRGNATALFEDRDGNLWIGTTRGLERWRDGVFTTWAAPEGVVTDAIGPIHVDPQGRVWFAPVDGGLFRMDAGRIQTITAAGLADDVIYSIAGDGPDIWVGRQRGGLTRLAAHGDAHDVRQFTHTDGLVQNSVYAVLRARDGSVWAGSLSAGASRLANGRFTAYTVADGLASNTVATMLETADGALWFGTPNGLSRMAGDGWRRYTMKDGLPSNDIHTLYQDADGHVWVGTAQGLAVLQGDRPPRAVASPPILRTPVLGITADAGGGLWLATAERLLRAPRARLAAGATIADADVRDYTLTDGLHSTEGVKRHRTAVTAPDGRVWLATRLGLSVADPDRAVSSTPPAIPQIERIAADTVPLDSAAPLSIAAGAQRILVSFTGLSLAVPERVRFRYRLDGFDRAWSEPTASRQAAYTNLAPGPYRFRVTASNSDGLWSGREATLSFDVEPAYWQTAWFRVSAVLLAFAAAWGLYRLRLVQLAHRMSARFEERLAERTRIAQDLHDTLLQGFVSASMQLHVVADRVPEDSPVRPPLARVQTLMSQVIEEGRNAVRGLRSPSEGRDDLDRAFGRVPAELAADRDVDFRVIVEGQPRRLHPLIRDDVYHIGREAIVNAYRHARAARVEVELEYTARRLRVLVRDDGCGIDDDVLQSGREGHWGLSGMRERAERIGAHLSLWSRAGAGSEVALVVPSHVAFQHDTSSTWRRWIERLFRRR